MGEEDQKQRHSLKPFAFAAVVFSTFAISSVLITFPLILTHIQTLESTLRNDLDFCKSRSRDMWKEVLEIKLHGKGNLDRLTRIFISHKKIHKRDTMSDFWQRRLKDQGPETEPEVILERQEYSEGVPDLGGSCCTCSRGAPGPRGPPGEDGLPGLDGLPGPLGPPGPPAPPGPDPQSLFPPQCPCEALPGDVGPKGPPGPVGNPGPPGRPGEDGKPGDQGSRGSAGLPGQPGQAGRAGAPGEPGTYRVEVGPPGKPGTPGRPGPPGQPGPPGPPGEDGAPGIPGPSGPNGPPGIPGQNGEDGFPGKPGENGAKGSCDHCPPPRLAPGY